MMMMMNNWAKITDDPETLPPLDVPVFAAGGSLFSPCILVRSEVRDHNGDTVWAWCNSYGDVWYDTKNKRWACSDSVWDDDYQPAVWHPFPEPPEDIQ